LDSLIFQAKKQCHRGILISIEGVDGAGKSTIAGDLERKLVDGGYQVRMVREPGGTTVSEKIRELLLDPIYQEMTARTEAMLYAAARVQLVVEVLESCLDAGMVVICDRYTDSTLAYQGGGRGIDQDWLRTLNRLATQELVPDLTLLLDIEPVLGRSRRLQRQSAKKLAIDRLEAESEAFYYRVREAYLNLAKQEPRRIRIIDAGKPLAQVGEEAWLQVRDVLERWGEQSLI
jgi:dTMP kinase